MHADTMPRPCTGGSASRHRVFVHGGHEQEGEGMLLSHLGRPEAALWAVRLGLRWDEDTVSRRVGPK